MERYKYVILGAGPSGLSFAETLKQLGESSFLVLEKEEVAGGLCRSKEVDGAPLDIGGGHFLDVKRSEVLEFLFQFMPRSEWRAYRRSSRIRLGSKEIDYPLEANLWQLSLEEQVEYLESMVRAGSVRGTPEPKRFEEWILWKFGERMAADYMLPYNRKIWSTDLNELGTYWLYKLPSVSFSEILKSCLERRANGSVPAHGIFLYPKRFGYGEVWKRIAEDLGDHLLTSTPVWSIDIGRRIVNGRFQADLLITTIPWTCWLSVSNIPKLIGKEISKLRFASVDIDYFQDSPSTDAHWIYEPNESVSYHRVLCRGNFLKGSRGYWTETNSKRSVNGNGWHCRNEFAYPLNTIGKPKAVSRICDWARRNRIIALGRWGRWEHINSDVAVATGIETARKCVQGEW